MILDSLRMTNIRSHKETHVTFPTGGITLFHGNIGSGKSTILMGIEFALFGLGSAKGDSLLAKNADTGEVVLEFSVGDTKYEVGRTLKRARANVTQNSKDSYLRVDGVKEPLTVSQLRVRILDILGLNEPTSSHSKSRIYRYAVFTPQDEMKNILSDPEKRFETIRKIFRMEDYQTAIKNTDALKSEIRLRMGRYAARSENLDQKRADLKEATKYVSDVQGDIKRHADDEYNLVAKEKKAKSDMSIYEKRMQEKNTLEVRLARITSDINSNRLLCGKHQKTITDNKEQLDKLQGEYGTLAQKKRPTSRQLADIESDIARFASIHEDVITTRTKIASAQKQLGAIMERLARKSYSGGNEESLQKEIDSNRTAMESLAGDIQNMRMEYEKANDSQIRASQEEQGLKKRAEDLQGLGAKCSVCGHILTKEHLDKQRDELQGMLQNVQSELARLVATRAEKSDAIRGMEERQSLLHDEEGRLDALMSDVAERKQIAHVMQQDQTRLKSLDSENAIPKDPDFENDTDTTNLHTPAEYLATLRDALVQYEHLLERTDNIKSDIARLEKSNQDAERELEKTIQHTRNLESEHRNISAEIKTYDQDSSAKKDIQDTLDNISDSLRDTRDRLSTCRANFEAKSAAITTLESEIKFAEKWQKKHNVCETHLDWLGDFFVPSVSQIEKSVMLSLQSTFNESYHKWYSQLIDDPTKDSRIDEEFAPIVEQDGFSQSIEYMSGGEKTSIALSYRLALNHTMRRQTKSLESNLLILDEPTDGLSNEQLAHVRELLHGLESKQIILVSHNDEMISHMDYVFEVTKTSGVTTVTQAESTVTVGS